MNSAFQATKFDFDALLIFGAGGSGREVAWLARQRFGTRVRMVFVVDKPEFLTAPIHGLPVQLLDDCDPDPGARFVVAVGNSSARQRISREFERRGFQAATLIHPRVEASDTVHVGEGSIVCAGTILTVDIAIGRHVHVNVDCTISHDAVIGDFATLSPGVHVSGHVMIGKGAFIGTGANIINGKPEAPLIIGDDAVIAAGACVTRSVEAGALVAGVPAVRKR